MSTASPRAPRAARYPIRVASRLTGIPADRLRMWERRYGYPRPLRGDAGARSYSDDDVACLRLIEQALQSGFRAGDVVGRSRAELARLVGEEAASAPGPVSVPPSQVVPERLLDLLRADDAQALRSGLRQSVATLGAERFLVEVAHPLAVRIGQLWAAGEARLHQEHLLTNILSTQIRHLLATYEEGGGGPAVLLTTLPGERHGLGLEITALHLSLLRASPCLIGTETPIDDIVRAARSFAVRAVGLSVVAPDNLEEQLVQIDQLAARLPAGVELWLGGGAAPHVDPKNRRVRRIQSVEALREATHGLAAAP